MNFYNNSLTSCSALVIIFEKVADLWLISTIKRIKLTKFSKIQLLTHNTETSLAIGNELALSYFQNLKIQIF